MESIGIAVLGLAGEAHDELCAVLKQGRGAEVLVLGCGGILSVERTVATQLGAQVTAAAGHCRRGIHAQD